MEAAAEERFHHLDVFAGVDGRVEDLLDQKAVVEGHAHRGDRVRIEALDYLAARLRPAHEDGKRATQAAQEFAEVLADLRIAHRLRNRLDLQRRGGTGRIID